MNMQSRRERVFFQVYVHVFPGVCVCVCICFQVWGSTAVFACAGICVCAWAEDGILDTDSYK